ncbi:fluoride efflux transporter CrcB [Lentiprolixibacter aurantiacus]|uniref:Fluoride-specific ion channel FluC n=1 Tax=Lentiprolixibacter aurantiacus TaxID=2993939 RepID=A0AAE3MN74_9FLAO|nr:fluoride efflux transporter CrcB [Lentiprolixibacter aurantiacus]MCX2720528.1 fluoride efflux transporter CrcB [Lentiprolixibacter aurantiacus]
MKQAFLVFLGGGIGSCLRYLISKSLNPVFSNFFLGTFLVNLIGCFLIGIILGYAMKGSLLSQSHVLLLATGFCGGFTTFSAFAFENHNLIRMGDYLNLSLYTLGSIIISIAAVFLGIWISKNL